MLLVFSAMNIKPVRFQFIKTQFGPLAKYSCLRKCFLRLSSIPSRSSSLIIVASVFLVTLKPSWMHLLCVCLKPISEPLPFSPVSINSITSFTLELFPFRYKSPQRNILWSCLKLITTPCEVNNVCKISL